MESHTALTLQEDDTALAYEFARKFPVRFLGRSPCAFSCLVCSRVALALALASGVWLANVPFVLPFAAASRTCLFPSLRHRAFCDSLIRFRTSGV